MPAPRRRPGRFKRWREEHSSILQAIAILGAIGTLASGFYLFDGQYQRKADAQAHAHDDTVRALWGQLGTAQLRASTLEDRVYDLAARKAALGKQFPIPDDLSLQRYTKQLEQYTARVAELRRQIDELNKDR